MMHEFSTKREMVTYRYGEIETPFLQKDQNEDRELGCQVKAMYFWKRLSMISLIVSFLLLFLLIFEVMSPRIHVLAADILQSGVVKQVGWLRAMS